MRGNGSFCRESSYLLAGCPERICGSFFSSSTLRRCELSASRPVPPEYLQFLRFFFIIETYDREIEMSPSKIESPPAKYDHIYTLPKTAPVEGPVDARKIAQEWLGKFEAILTSGDFSRIGEVFHEESWFRDMIALQWDFRTLHGREKIQEFLSQHQPKAGASSFHLQESGHFAPKLEDVKKDINLAWVSSLFHFETKLGKGAGVLRLTQEKPGEWKAFAFYTVLQELTGHEERLGERRAYGTIDSMPGGFSRGTWFERRERQLNFLDEEPQVVIIGAGKSLKGI